LGSTSSQHTTYPAEASTHGVMGRDYSTGFDAASTLRCSSEKLLPKGVVLPHK